MKADAKVFRPPIILKSAERGTAAMMRDTAVTALLWLVWAALIGLTFGYFGAPDFARDLIPVALPADRRQVLRLAMFCVVTGMVICALLVTRMLIDRWRFSGNDRRRSIPLPGDDVVAAEIGTTAPELQAWRASRWLTVHHDEEGRISGTEMKSLP